MVEENPCEWEERNPTEPPKTSRAWIPKLALRQRLHLNSPRFPLSARPSKDPSKRQTPPSECATARPAYHSTSSSTLQRTIPPSLEAETARDTLLELAERLNVVEVVLRFDEGRGVPCDRIVHVSGRNTIDVARVDLGLALRSNIAGLSLINGSGVRRRFIPDPKANARMSERSREFFLTFTPHVQLTNGQPLSSAKHCVTVRQKDRDGQSPVLFVFDGVEDRDAFVSVIALLQTHHDVYFPQQQQRQQLTASPPDQSPTPLAATS